MNIYLQIILGVCAVATSAGIAFAQFRKGARGETGDIAKFYKERMEDYKLIADETRKEYTAKHEDLLKRFGVLQGEFNTEKALRIQYETILKDRNPETEAFMVLVTKAVTDQGEVNKEVVAILKQIHEYAKEEHDKTLEITSTVTTLK